MFLWVDDVRPAPKGYYWCKSVNETISTIQFIEGSIKAISQGQLDTDSDKAVVITDFLKIKGISLDHDAGDYYPNGGDYIKILDWLEQNKLSYPIQLHTMNCVGRDNMQRIIDKNGWKVF